MIKDRARHNFDYLAITHSINKNQQSKCYDLWFIFKDIFKETNSCNILTHS